MTLREALLTRGDDPSTIDETIADMVASVNAGDDPEDVLFEEGLEPDYVIDLIDEC
jgi:hypothetical protein